MPEGPRFDPADLARGGLAVHIVGIGGANMSTIAWVLAAMGNSVSGSDQKALPALARLEAVGVRTFVGHSAEHLSGADVVAYSAAVREDNAELAEARRLGVPVLTRASALAAICGARRTLAVSGTHGKTTTTALLATALSEAGLDPCYMVGGELSRGRGGAKWGPGRWLVVEADESDGTFLQLPAEGVVVTSVEADHLDHFGSLAALGAAFDQFVAQAPGPRVVCVDDPGAARLAGRATATYGTSEGADYRASDIELGRSSSSFVVEARGRRAGRARLSVPGLHNVRNAMGALAMAVEVGAPPSPVLESLAAFEGVGRRFEVRGERDGVTYVDDYAHNPGKVRAALAAARNGGWGRVVAVFQPHRYTRTAALWQDFADAFSDADLLFVTDVYPAGEPPVPGVTGRLVSDAVSAAHPGLPVEYVAERADLVRALRSTLGPGDLCLTMSAGDLTTLPGELLAAEEAQGVPPEGQTGEVGRR